MLCLIGMCVAASVIPPPVGNVNDDLAVAESANPQFGFFPGGGYGGYGGYGHGRGFGHRHHNNYGGKLHAKIILYRQLFVTFYSEE